MKLLHAFYFSLFRRKDSKLSLIFATENFPYSNHSTLFTMKVSHVLLFFFIVASAHAQWNWTDPQKAGYPVIQGQGFTKEIGQTYVRLPDRAKDKINPHVWYLSRNSTGLSIHFYSNAPSITVRYQVTDRYAMSHMPATGVSGIDLYSIDSDGAWKRHTTSNYSFKDTIQYVWQGLTKDKYHDRGYEYRLYLPLYNTVSWMEIGIPENSQIEYLPQRKEKPIVVYGTSIAQGGCASRPGMAWPTIVQRKLDYPLINLGFSGSGRLEKEVLDFICEIDAQLYILDCLPNLTGVDENTLNTLTRNAIQQIRTAHYAPILLVEHSSGCNSYGNSDCAARNEASRRIFEALQSEGVKDLYYLSCSEINMPEEGIVDYVHPSDLGMQVEADAYEKKIREILKQPEGSLPTTRPVTQRREPDNYEWQKRHREILELNAEQPPKAIILGNSITHFWGGEPTAPRQTGKDSWDKIMRPLGFHNLGYGYDRIENVLWRVYHGELDGYEAEKVVVKIGTNNLYLNSDEEIVEGLRFLLTAIRERQPKAVIKVIGLLPRRNAEEKIKALNKRIQQMVHTEGYKYMDVGSLLLLSNGKINEALFSDGLHPNAKGYRKIAKLIVE